MPQIGEINIIGNVHFIFIPEYPEARLRAHWASLNGNRVHVYEPGLANLWTVAAYSNDAKKDLFECEIAKMRTSSEYEAFKNASLWAEDSRFYL
jgi:hypothetical protein